MCCVLGCYLPDVEHAQVPELPATNCILAVVPLCTIPDIVHEAAVRVKTYSIAQLLPCHLAASACQGGRFWCMLLVLAPCCALPS